MIKEFLLDTCIVLEIIQGNEKTKLWISDLNEEDKIMISGWTIIELMKEQTSQKDMQECLKKLSQYKVLWTKPEFCDDIPELLIKNYHTERDNDGKLKGNPVFDCLIYKTSKSNSSPIIVTRDGHFDWIGDVEVLNLQKEDRYKRSDFS